MHVIIYTWKMSKKSPEKSQAWCLITWGRGEAHTKREQGGFTPGAVGIVYSDDYVLLFFSTTRLCHRCCVIENALIQTFKNYKLRELSLQT